MKVLYEISVLSESYIAERSKAGIYRVITSFLNYIPHKDNYELHGTSQKTGLHTVLAKRYLLENELGSLKSFISAWDFHPLLLIFFKGLAFRICLSTSNELINEVQRKILIFLAEALTSASRQTPIDNVDVYHSFFYALPKTDKVKAKARFITVYDMIPILMPHLFSTRMEANFKQIISSIDIYNDWVVCISESTKRDFCQYTSMSEDRVFVTPLGTSSLFFSVDDETAIQSVLTKYGIPSKRYILALSTLEPRKNTIAVIKAFEKMIEAAEVENDLCLVLAGAKGWLFNEIFASISDSSDIKERIIFTGRVADEDLSALYSGALFFVYPSLYEGFGLPPLESMTCGTPVITSNNSSLPEVVGDAGIMIDVKEQDSLLKAMTLLYKDVSLRHELAALSLKQANKFSWDRCTQLTFEAYEEALKDADLQENIGSEVVRSL